MSDYPVIDPAAVERLKEWGGEELPKKMLEIFLSHSPERIDQIREGISTGDARMAETGAHSLKSSAANVGAVLLQKLCFDAENMAEQSNLDDLKALLPQLEDSFSTAIEELKVMLEGMGK